MKARESGMPDEKIWQQFFDVERIFKELEINNGVTNLVDFGFGYGTFTIPASRIIKGKVYSFDIEVDLYNAMKEKIKRNSINNINLFHRDFITDGTGITENEIDYAMLFNILHAERSEDLLKETFRILKNKGKLGIIHWNYDPDTPRGPNMSIRPKPNDLRDLLIKSEFIIIKYNINLPPYHYGILAQKIIE